MIEELFYLTTLDEEIIQKNLYEPVSEEFVPQFTEGTFRVINGELFRVIDGPAPFDDIDGNF